MKVYVCVQYDRIIFCYPKIAIGYILEQQISGGGGEILYSTHVFFFFKSNPS